MRDRDGQTPADAAQREPSDSHGRQSILAGIDRNPLVPLMFRLLSLGVMALILFRTAWMSDDAYITLRTIDNFVHGYGLRWNVAERVQTFTHPLWLFLEAVPYFITREAFYTSAILSIGISLIAVGLFLFRSRVNGTGALALGMGMLVCSRAFVDYSTSGLENPLTHLLLVLFLIALTRENAIDLKRLFLLSGIAGLATLNRIDSVLLLGPPLLYAMSACRHFGIRKVFGVVVTGFTPFFLWEVFATLYYGSPFPNSAIAKLNTGIDAITLIRHGYYYMLNSLRADPVTLIVIIAALAVVAVSRECKRGRQRAIAVGILLYLLYVLRVGGDFMSGRFLSAPFLAAVFLLAHTDPFPLRRAGRPLLAAVVLLLGTALTQYPPIVSGKDFGTRTEKIIDRHGICDERRYYFATSGMFNGARTTQRPSGWGPAVVGGDARRSGSPLIVEGAVGVAGYFAGPGTRVLDFHAIGDPLLSRVPAVVNDTRYQSWMLALINDLDPQGWRIGHYRRQIPKGYLATLLLGNNQIADPNLARFYDHLCLVTQGPPWSLRRLTAAIEMSFGRWNALLPRTRPQFDDPIDWAEILAVDPNLPEPLFQLAQESSMAGDDDVALARLEEVIRIAPQHVRALVLMGRIWMGRGDAQRADACMDRALAIAPELLGAAKPGGVH